MLEVEQQKQERQAYTGPLRVAKTFIQRREDYKLLLIRRWSGDEINAGLWEGPGGKLNKGQTFVRALHREVKEETNLQIQVIRGVSDFRRMIDTGDQAGRVYWARIYVSRLIESNSKIELTEHDAHVWVSYEQMMDEYRNILTNEMRLAAPAAKPLLPYKKPSKN